MLTLNVMSDDEQARMLKAIMFEMITWAGILRALKANSSKQVSLKS